MLVMVVPPVLWVLAKTTLFEGAHWPSSESLLKISVVLGFLTAWKLLLCSDLLASISWIIWSRTGSTLEMGTSLGLKMACLTMPFSVSGCWADLGEANWRGATICLARIAWSNFSFCERPLWSSLFSTASWSFSTGERAASLSLLPLSEPEFSEPWLGTD